MFKPLQNILDTCIIKTPTWQHYIMKEWNTIVGTLSERMVLEKVYEDTLIIGVYESQWLQELHLLSHVIIKEINQHLEQPYIKKLRFKHSVKKQIRSKKQDKQNDTLTFIPLTIHEEKMLNTLNDPALRTAVHQFFSRCKHNTSHNKHIKKHSASNEKK